MNWEDWLKSAVKPPSETEDAKWQRTLEQIKATLNAHEPLKGRPWRIYAKGSYANNTNVRLNFDVDIAVEYHGYFYYDLLFGLSGQDKSVVGITPSTDPYTRDQFKQDILDALTASYGKDVIETGDIAYRIGNGRTTLPADVVPCWEYRRYDGVSNGEPTVHIGSRIFTSKSKKVDNYPKRQLLNGTNKNNRTGRRYKRMARALKKLQTRLVEDGELTAELPSYLIECLAYNVPDENFGHDTYLADFRAVLAVIFNSTLDEGDWNDWKEVNELKWLFRGPQKWTREQVHDFANNAWKHVGFE